MKRRDFLRAAAASAVAACAPDTTPPGANGDVVSGMSLVTAAVRVRGGGLFLMVVKTTNLFAYPEQVDMVKALAKEKPVAVVALRAPYDILSVPEIPAYLCAYDSREPSLVAAAEVLLGERKPLGSLPALIPGLFSLGAGMRDFA
jgi:hypothetical protein